MLLRHGQSEWNEQNRFTGWVDVDLSARGEDESRTAGQQLAASGLDLRVLHTSVLTRAIRTAELALREARRSWLPVWRDWRLNERHYGSLTGRNKVETAERYGVEQVTRWRRSYDEPPPELEAGGEPRLDEDPRYRDVPAGQLPRTECLKDVVGRVRPWLEERLRGDLTAEAERGGAVLVVAHGNSLRALRMLLESMTPEEVVGCEVPTGIPFVYELDEDLGVRSGSYLGDAEAAARAAEAVANQIR